MSCENDCRNFAPKEKVDETLEALRASVKHWEENLKKARRSEYFRCDGSGCPLCAKFSDGMGNCSFCPVKLKTGEGSCRGTPFYRARDSRTIEDVQDELNFLKELRDEYEYAGKIEKQAEPKPRITIGKDSDGDVRVYLQKSSMNELCLYAETKAENYDYHWQIIKVNDKGTISRISGAGCSGLKTDNTGRIIIED